nr:hypothetical protein [Mycobacterium leprae]
MHAEATQADKVFHVFIRNLRIALDNTPVNGDKKLLQLVQKRGCTSRFDIERLRRRMYELEKVTKEQFFD